MLEYVYVSIRIYLFIYLLVFVYAHMHMYLIILMFMHIYIFKRLRRLGRLYRQSTGHSEGLTDSTSCVWRCEEHMPWRRR